MFTSLLTDQLELFGDSTTQSSKPPSLLADEVLPPRSKSVEPIQNALLDCSSSKPSWATQSPYPAMKQARHQSRAKSYDRTDSESPSEHSSSSESVDSDSMLSTLLGQSKIPKPPGEPGRPGRGGYNLETAIDWNHKVFTKFKVCPFRYHYSIRNYNSYSTGIHSQAHR